MTEPTTLDGDGPGPVEQPPTPADLQALVGLAEEAVGRALDGDRTWRPAPTDVPPALTRPGAAFVTLRRDGRLLGCVGTMTPGRSLADVVADRAVAAAFEDPRTRGVARSDFEHLDVEVSVLSPLAAFAVGSYEELLRRLGPEGDRPRAGLLIDAGRHRATFLPDVWEQLPDAETFLAELWRKAGLKPRAWPAGITVSTYSTMAAHGHPPRLPRK